VKAQWEMHRVNGKLVANKSKPPIRKKNDTWFVDAPITGSNEGTAAAPKFTMLGYFKYKILPILDKMTKGPEDGSPAGEYHGYTVVLQGDNASPHAETGFKEFIGVEFEKRGWLVENQAPQSPYVNVCDLAIFPCMSKRCTHLLSKTYGFAIPKVEAIFAAAETVWNDLDSCNIARAFIQARRVHNIIIEDGGSQAWLTNGGPHCHCRRDFVNGEDCVSVVPRPGRPPAVVQEYLPFRERLKPKKYTRKN
jgi:hypothetical protein